MTEETEQDALVEHVWRTYLTTGEYEDERRHRRLFRMLPGAPRCKSCYAPLQGAGSIVVKLFYGKRPSTLNPHLCNACEEFARQHQGGAEIELSLLFADVRGSTTMAKRMKPKEYSQLINRFYIVAAQVLVDSDALIDKIISDQVAGMYVPGFAGQKHARRAIEAARQILGVTGHGGPEKPWIPLGAGVHTGTAFVGSVGSDEGMVDITVLGDAANTAARLSTSARQGEILISEAATDAAVIQTDNLEKRALELKGKSKTVTVFVLKNLSPHSSLTDPDRP
jgi:adenylate cyclase